MIDLILKITVFIGFFICIGAVLVFAGEVIPQQNIAPTNTIATEWIIAICAVVGTCLTAAVIYRDRRRKK